MNSRSSTLTAVVMASASVSASIGLATALLPLRMKAADFSITEIGVVGFGYGIGFLAGCLLATPLVQRLGYVRSFVGLSLACTVAISTLATSDIVFVWTSMRFICGVALAILMVLVDAWISSHATSANRGRTLSACYLANRAALMLSPLAVTVTHSISDNLIVLTAAFAFFSSAPIVVTHSRPPLVLEFEVSDIKKILSASPSAAVASMTSGMMFASVVSFSPVYGVAVGLAPSAAASLVFFMQAGALVVQWPVGLLSDKIDRRLMMACLLAGISIASIVIVTSANLGFTAGILAGFAMCGGSTFCIYPLCIAHGCDLVRKEKILHTVSVLLLCWAIGLTLGPLPSSLLMRELGVNGLLYFSMVVASIVGAILIFRVKAYPRVISQRTGTDKPPIISTFDL